MFKQVIPTANAQQINQEPCLFDSSKNMFIYYSSLLVSISFSFIDCFVLGSSLCPYCIVHTCLFLFLFLSFPYGPFFTVIRSQVTLASDRKTSPAPGEITHSAFETRSVSGAFQLTRFHIRR